MLLAVLLPQVAFAYSGVNLANDGVDAYYYCNSLFCLAMNDTTDAKDAGTNDVSVPTDLSDAMYFGYPQMFEGFAMDIYTSVSGYSSLDLGMGEEGRYDIEYWNGSSWTELDVEGNENTLGYTDYNIEDDSTTGVFALTWQRPTDWVKSTVGSSFSMYYVRMHIVEEYSSATTATASQVGIIDYNLKLEVLDELGYAIEGLEEGDFTLSETSGGDETIYSLKSLGMDSMVSVDPSAGSEYDFPLSLRFCWKIAK